MDHSIFFRKSTGELVEWKRAYVRDLTTSTAPDGSPVGGDEKFLEDLVAQRPELLGLAGTSDESTIEGDFKAFSQVCLQALNGRTIYPDLLLMWESGDIVIVEVKLADNPELRDRRVVAQLLEYAACLSQLTETELLDLLASPDSKAETWPGFIRELFPEVRNPERLANRFLDRFRSSKLHLIIACDEAPTGLRELVRGVIGQHALGEYLFRVVEIMPFVPDDGSSEMMFLPHSVLETEIVGRTAVTVHIDSESPQQQATVNVEVTPLEDVERESLRVREQKGSKRKFNAELQEAVELFNNTANGAYQATGDDPNYRKIKLPDIPGNMHYEFLYQQSIGYICVEFHIEDKRYRPIANTLQNLATDMPMINGGRVEFDPKWSANKGRLRVFPADPRPACAAETMLALIEATKEPIAKAITTCPPASQWDDAAFFEVAASLVDNETLRALHDIHNTATRNQWPVRWGTGTKPTMQLTIPAWADCYACSFSSDGNMWLSFRNLPDEIAEYFKKSIRALKGITFNDCSEPSIRPIDAWVRHVSQIIQILESTPPAQ